MRNQIQENLKALYRDQIQEEIEKSIYDLLEGSNEGVIEKGGKRAQIGETRVWGGNKYTKHQDGWVEERKDGKYRLHTGKGEWRDADQHHIDHHRESFGSKKEEGVENNIDHPIVHAQKQLDKIVKEYPNVNKLDDLPEHVRVSAKIHQGALKTAVELNNKKILEGSNRIKEYDDALDRLKEFANKNNLVPSSFNGIYYKDYGDNNFIKRMSIQIDNSFKDNSSHYSVDVAYNKTPMFGEESDNYYNELSKLKSMKFDSPQKALKAMDNFADRFNTGNIKPQNSKELGKTSSGKTVYEDGSEHEQDEDWGSKDHSEASKLHKEGKYAEQHSEKEKSKKITEDSSKTDFKSSDLSKLSVEQLEKKLEGAIKTGGEASKDNNNQTARFFADMARDIQKELDSRKADTSKKEAPESLLKNREIRSIVKENGEFRALIENGHLLSYVNKAIKNGEDLRSSKTLRERGMGPGMRLAIHKHIYGED